MVVMKYLGRGGDRVLGFVKFLLTGQGKKVMRKH